MKTQIKIGNVYRLSLQKEKEHLIQMLKSKESEFRKGPITAIYSRITRIDILLEEIIPLLKR